MFCFLVYLEPFLIDREHCVHDVPSFYAFEGHVCNTLWGLEYKYSNRQFTSHWFDTQWYAFKDIDWVYSWGLGLLFDISCIWRIIMSFYGATQSCKSWNGWRIGLPTVGKWSWSCLACIFAVLYKCKTTNEALVAGLSILLLVWLQL